MMIKILQCIAWLYQFYLNAAEICLQVICVYGAEDAQAIISHSWRSVIVTFGLGRQLANDPVVLWIGLV